MPRQDFKEASLSKGSQSQQHGVRGVIRNYETAEFLLE